MMNKIIAVITALIIALSACCVYAEAFEFGGSDRTKQEALADWFEALKEFAKDPVNKADDIVKANYRLNVDMMALGYEDHVDFINGITSGLVPGYDKFNDEALNQLTELLNKYGIDTPKQQFEEWYQEKFGKSYHAKAMINGKEGDYYIKTESADGNYKYIYILKYSGAPLTVYKNNAGVQYFSGQDMGLFAYRCYTKTKYSTGEWGDWVAGNWYDNSSITSFFALSNTVAVHSYDRINTTTNLPLNYWGDIIGGDPITDWDSLGDDFAEGEGAGLTPDEFDDFLTDLLNDLMNSMPDLSTVEGILQAIYRKCCSIDGKMGRQDKSNVSSAINQAVLALVASNNENANKIISALGDLKGDLNADTDEIAGKLDKIHSTLVAWGIADTVTDFVDLDSLTDGELSKINALADIAIMLSNLLPIAVVNTQITTLQAIVFRQAPPTDLTFTVLNSKCVMLSSDFFQQSDVIHAVSIARTLVSIILMMMWLLGMRRKLSSVG